LAFVLTQGPARLDRLLAGYRRFRAETWPADRARYQALSEQGQRPQSLIVSCSDSRVDPATVFCAAPGELFVIRNVAGIVPPYQPDGGCHGTSAALEFGVRVLRVARIVVLGHAQCGGVRAMVEGAPPEAADFVAPWMQAASAGLPAATSATASREEILAKAELAVVRASLANLMSFPWIAQAVRDETLNLHGMQFDIHTGVLAHVGKKGLEPVT
jgi:carbonic anhydrase